MLSSLSAYTCWLAVKTTTSNSSATAAKNKSRCGLLRTYTCSRRKIGRNQVRYDTTVSIHRAEAR